MAAAPLAAAGAGASADCTAAAGRSLTGVMLHSGGEQAGGEETRRLGRLLCALRQCWPSSRGRMQAKSACGMLHANLNMSHNSNYLRAGAILLLPAWRLVAHGCAARGRIACTGPRQLPGGSRRAWGTGPARPTAVDCIDCGCICADKAVALLPLFADEGQAACLLNGVRQ